MGGRNPGTPSGSSDPCPLAWRPLRLPHSHRVLRESAMPRLRLSAALPAVAAWLLLAAGLPAADEPIQVFFGPKAADDRDGLYFNLLRFLDSARSTLYGSVHEVDMVSVAEKLAERSRAGVDVQLVVEADWWGNAKNRAARRVLEKARIKVYPDTKKSGLMHNKFFVADGKRVW